MNDLLNAPVSSKSLQTTDLRRRRFLVFGAGGLAAASLGGTALLASGPAAAVRSNAHIVIAGAGAAGVAMANRLRRGLDGARIRL